MTVSWTIDPLHSAACYRDKLWELRDYHHRPGVFHTEIAEASYVESIAELRTLIERAESRGATCHCLK